jgi:hypothetical protein
MAQESNENETAPTNQNLRRKIHAIYSGGDQSMLHEVTQLLVNALRDEDDRSRSALGEFFNLPVSTETETTQLGLGLVQRARLLIDGPTANRVQTWIVSYERSEPDSQRRSLYESILRDFVSSKSQVEELKRRLKQAHRLTFDTRSKCDALKEVVRRISRRTR